MQLFKTLGAAFFAVGLVAAELVLSGCGAEADRGSSDGEEIGQTTEAFVASGLSNGRTMGANFHVGTYDACSTTGSTTQDCRWLDPYQWHIQGDQQPSRFNVYMNMIGSSTFTSAAATTLVHDQILPWYNGFIIGSGKVWDLGLTSNGLTILAATKAPAPPSGDTNVYDYFSIDWSLCHPIRTVESPSEPGVFRTCDSMNMFLDVDRLRANFAANRFSGNFKQMVVVAMNMALGVGLQRNQVSYSNYGLSVTQQSSTVPFSAVEKGDGLAGLALDPHADHGAGFF